MRVLLASTALWFLSSAMPLLAFFDRPAISFALTSANYLLAAADLLLIILLLMRKYLRSDIFAMGFRSLCRTLLLIGFFCWLTLMIFYMSTPGKPPKLASPVDFLHWMTTDLPFGGWLLMSLFSLGALAVPPYLIIHRLMKQQKADHEERDDLQNRMTKANAWASNESKRSRQMKAELIALRAGETFIKENSHVSVAVKEEFSRIIRETQKAQEQALAGKDRRR